MSCDKNQDLFEPFHHCMEKYWKDHPEIIYSTETVVNPYYKTICCNLPFSSWTKRVVETIKDLPCRNILLLVDDIFIRNYVDNDLVWLLQEQYVKDNVGALNFEKSFDKNDIPLFNDIYKRNPTGRYKLSLMCQMWQKRAILDLFNVDKDCWQFEKENKAKDWQFLISANGDIIDWGRNQGDWQFGIVKGKWARECKEFFDQENIEIDYSIRGFIEKGEHY